MTRWCFVVLRGAFATDIPRAWLLTINDLQITKFPTSLPLRASNQVVGGSNPSGRADDKGELLNGSNTYRMHLPAPIPARAFWAVTIYNPADGTMPLTDQPYPSRNGLDKPQYNADGSIDLYTGPTKPQNINDKNWIQNPAWQGIPGHPAAVRLRDRILRSDVETG